MPRKFGFRRRHFFAGILCVLQEKVTKYERKFSGICLRRINQRLLGVCANAARTGPLWLRGLSAVRLTGGEKSSTRSLPPALRATSLNQREAFRFLLFQQSFSLSKRWLIRLRHLPENLCSYLVTFSCNTQSIPTKKCRRQSPNFLGIRSCQVNHRLLWVCL